MLAERLIADELMDDPALPARVYRAVLADLARANRMTLGYRPTLAFLGRALRGRRRFRLLDVGFGQGDMLRRIARWANARGLSADLTGIDLNPKSKAAAEAFASPGAPIRYRTGDYAACAGEGFDFVVSSLVTHHMDRAEIIAFLRFMDAEAGAGWFINDLHRHAFALRAYPVLARAMRWHPIVRQDGATSIARSFRPADWERLLADAGVSGATIARRFPFRLCVSAIR